MENKTGYNTIQIIKSVHFLCCIVSFSMLFGWRLYFSSCKNMTHGQIRCITFILNKEKFKKNNDDLQILTNRRNQILETSLATSMCGIDLCQSCLRGLVLQHKIIIKFMIIENYIYKFKFILKGKYNTWIFSLPSFL